ncbi:MAG TPA: type I-C CRISPR-associated protein Cas5c [Terracidiphilus sp.]|nr:type I-C CRISPR-associated protein Cas5c [Terracidiphilus sp.]
MPIPSVRVRVSGEFACFTRPEAKVERFSYPIMTPSAARNVLDAICWRPQMRWIVTSISVLKPIRLMSVLRNEVQSKISPGAVKKWMRDASTFEPLVAGAGKGTDGTPRNTTLLRDVAYWIDAYPHVFDASGDNTPVKYVEMMRRRVEKGQCFQRPYLGCREFAAEFGPPQEEDRPVTDSMEIGRMLYDIAFLPDGNRAAFFEARLENGVMETRPETVLADEARRQEVLECSYRR